MRPATGPRIIVAFSLLQRRTSLNSTNLKSRFPIKRSTFILQLLIGKLGISLALKQKKEEIIHVAATVVVLIPRKTVDIGVVAIQATAGIPTFQMAA